MFTVTCTCNQSYTIEIENLAKKDKVICQNCDKELPQFILQSLKGLCGHKKGTKDRMMQTTGQKWEIKVDTCLYG